MINHSEKLSLFVEEFSTATVMKDYTNSFLDESNELENIFQDLLDDRSVDTAVGVQLDQVGLLVGELRNRRDDEEFRNAIKLKIAVNTSSGTVEDIIRVIKLLFGEETGSTVLRTGKALLTIFIDEDKPTDDIIPFLQQVLAAGVKIDSVIYPSDRLPWIATERGGVTQDTGVLPERGDLSPTVRVLSERIE